MLVFACSFHWIRFGWAESWKQQFCPAPNTSSINTGMAPAFHTIDMCIHLEKLQWLGKYCWSETAPPALIFVGEPQICASHMSADWPDFADPWKDKNGDTHHHYSFPCTSAPPPRPALPCPLLLLLFLMIHPPGSAASLYPADYVVAGWRGTKTSIVSHVPPTTGLAMRYHVT